MISVFICAPYGDHIIKPSTQPEGMLFNAPAIGLAGERAERRRTLDERCEFIAKLVDHDRPAVVWCHMNAEGDELEKLIPGSVQIAGRHSDVYKEAAIEWFQGNICRCQLTAICKTDKLSTCPRELPDTGNSGIQTIVRRESPNPLNTPSGTRPSGKRTSPTTTKETSRSTSSTLNERSERTPSGADATEATRFTVNGSRPLSENTSALTRKCGGQVGSESTDSPLPSTKRCSNGKGESALSAATPKTAFTLTTVMRPEKSGDYSASTAITGSVSSGIVYDFSSLPCPICGRHREAHRVLITKPIMGVGSEVYGSLINGRRAIGVELKETYYRQAAKNIKLAIETKVSQGELFQYHHDSTEDSEDSQ